MVEEYEIDTSAVEALNSMERRAAIETGQECEPDRSDLTLVDDGGEGAFHSGARLTAIKLLKRSTPAAFRVLFSFGCTGPLYLPVPVCNWKLLGTRRGVCLHVSTITMNACDEHDQSRGANAFAEEEYTEINNQEGDYQ